MHNFLTEKGAPYTGRVYSPLPQISGFCDNCQGTDTAKATWEYLANRFLLDE